MSTALEFQTHRFDSTGIEYLLVEKNERDLLLHRHTSGILFHHHFTFTYSSSLFLRFSERSTNPRERQQQQVLILMFFFRHLIHHSVRPLLSAPLEILHSRAVPMLLSRTA